MSKPQKQAAIAPEDEVLRRMLQTPPKPHKDKPAPAKKRAAKKASKP